MLTQELCGAEGQDPAEFKQDMVLPTRYVHHTPEEREGPEPKSIQGTGKISPISPVGFASCCGF